MIEIKCFVKDIERPKSRNPNMIKDKSDVINNVMTLFEGGEMVHNSFKSGIFSSPNQSIVLAEPEKSSSSHQKSYQSTPAITMNLFHLKKIL